MSMSNTDNIIAKTWRKRKGYVERGGCIVMYGDTVQSWCVTLPSPHDWRPGSIAVTDCEHWLAVGGNDFDGAAAWMRIN